MWYAPIRARFCPARGFLFVLHGSEKNDKNTLLFLNSFTTELKFQPSVCTIILVTLCIIMVLWYL